MVMVELYIPSFDPVDVHAGLCLSRGFSWSSSCSNIKLINYRHIVETTWVGSETIETPTSLQG
jgi:hypothetical protein